MMQVCADREALSRAAADLFLAHATAAVAARGRFSAALSGGSTPRRTYELLATSPWRERVPWPQVQLFWGDERCVTPDDSRSNYRMTREALLDHVPLPSEQIHRIEGELPPPEAAARYEQVLRRYFAADPPRFDLVYLGLGDNGHTASLFPHTPVLHEAIRWAAEVYVAEQQMYRVTLTASLLNQAATTVFLVAGAEKANVLREVRNGPRDPERLPAQLIQPSNGSLLWLVDRAAAGTT